jgi:hypothetical protein
MASTYSPSLKITLMGDGDQAGLWGQTTNTNLGTLVEQAITGTVSITMADANYTLTSFNGVSDEARNAVLVVTGTNNAVRDLIPPVAEKLYTIVNNTTGGFAIRVIGASGTGVNIPNGATCLVYCDGTNFVNGLSGTSGNFTINGTGTAANLVATSNVTATNITASANISSANATFSATVTAPTAANGTNTTQVATTAFVNAAVTTATGSLGTMSTQNASNVAITGGTITGITDLAVADGGTGSSTLAANAVLLGNGTSALQTVAPGTSGNLLVSNGTTWTAATVAASGLKLGLGITGENWVDVTGSRSSGVLYTNSLSYPIAVSARTTAASTPSIGVYVNGVFIQQFSWQFNGAGAFGGAFTIVPAGATYQLNFNGAGVATWAELY